MAGRPKGAWSEKRFREALQAAVTEEGAGGQKRLRNIAEQLVRAAEGGDIQAIKEVADRLDGKPNQSHDVEVSANDRLLSLIEAGIARAGQR
jgi:hypothetical protein